MTIRRRLVVGFGGIVALLLVLGGASIWTIQALKHWITSDLAEHAHIEELALEAKSLVLQHRRFEKDLFLNMGNAKKQGEYLEKFNQAADQLRTILTDLKGKFVDEHAALGDDLATATDAYATYRADFKAIAQEAIAGAIPTATAANQRMAPLKNSIHATEAGMEAIATKTKHLLAGSLKDASAFAVSRTTLIIVVFLIMAVLALFAGGTSFLVITRGVRTIKTGIGPIADGNLAERISYAGRDELGDIAQAINSLVAGMQDGLRKIAETVRETDRAAQELSAAATRIATNTEETTAQASQVATAAAQASTNTGTITETTRKMSTDMTSVAMDVEQLCAAITEVSRSCEQESQIATEAEAGARDTRERMERLGQAAKEIGKVVEVISRIAAQTNLLALNATIEAASAGMAGKGFAVVANEVKELARKTTGATAEIRAKIEEMQNSTEEVVSGMNGIGTIISRLHETSQSIVDSIGLQNTAMNGIASRVADSTRASNEIAGNVAETANGVSEISRTIESLGDATRDSAEGVTKVKTSAEDLARMSATLGGLVARYSLD